MGIVRYSLAAFLDKFVKNKELFSLAGFFGFFDFTKEGPGVSKDTPQKKRFFQFFELYFRKLSKLVSVNLLFLLFCLPAIFLATFFLPTGSILFYLTIPLCLVGPPMAGMTYVVRNLAREQPVFMFSDFWDSLKSNFKQSLAYGIIFSVIFTLLIFALLSYIGLLGRGLIYYALLGLTLAAALLFSFMNCYIYLQIVTVNLNIRGIISNAFRFAVLGFKTNILTVLFCGILVFLTLWFFPYTLLFLVPLGFSTISMITCFNSYQYLEKYVIEPYYAAHPEERPGYRPDEEEEEAVFSDKQLIPEGENEEDEEDKS